MSTGIRARLSVAALVVVVASISTSVVAMAATVTNGGFELGTLSGWTVVNQAGSAGT